MAPTHYRCRVCGFQDVTGAFPYKGYGTVLCCPECGSDALEAKVIEGTSR